MSETCRELATDDLVTTCGGGPLVRDDKRDRHHRHDGCCNVVGWAPDARDLHRRPVTAVQGAGFLAGLRTRRPAKNIQSELLARGILTGTSADPNVVRILAPYVLEERHVVELRDALAGLTP